MSPLLRIALFGFLISLGLGHAQSDTGSGDATAASTLYFVHVDHLNTPREIYNQNQQLVWRRPLGEPFGDSPADEDPSSLGPFGFPFAESGYREDRDIGRRYAMFRDCYDPALGRFCQSDPTGLFGGINPYTYADGTPVSRVDPLGLEVQFAGDPRTQSALRSAYQVVRATRRGAQLCEALERSSVVYTIKGRGPQGRAYWDPRTSTIHVDPEYRPVVSTTAGPIPATTDVMLGHEMGHAATGLSDYEGPAPGSNVIRNENPIRIELRYPPRTAY